VPRVVVRAQPPPADHVAALLLDVLAVALEHDIPDVDTCAERLVQLALRAGGGDNVTVVVADVLELDQVRDGAGPRTNAVVVGSAAVTRNRPTSAQDGPAARAAELSRQAAASTPGGGVPAVEDDEDDPDERRTRRRRRIRGTVVTLLVVLLVAAGATGFYRWTQTQYYVGVDGEVVAIYRGIPQSIGPLTLSDVVERTELAVDDLPGFVRDRVEQTIHTASLADARTRVDALAEDAAAEQPAEQATRTPRPTASATGTAAP